MGSSPSINNGGWDSCTNGGAGGGGDDGIYASIKCWGWDENCEWREGSFWWSLIEVVEYSLLPR
jgi:hypothetical protein